MTIEQQTCSLELAKKLKELGVKQESYFFWAYSRKRANHHCTGKHHPRTECLSRAFPFSLVSYLEKRNLEGGRTEKDWFSAFTAAELGELLPNNTIHYSKDGDAWCCLYDNNLQDGHGEFGRTEAEARAKMLIYLVDKKKLLAG